MSISTPPRRRMFSKSTSMFTRATWVQSRRVGCMGARPLPMPGRWDDGMNASPAHAGRLRPLPYPCQQQQHSRYGGLRPPRNYGRIMLPLLAVIYRNGPASRRVPAFSPRNIIARPVTGCAGTGDNLPNPPASPRRTLSRLILRLTQNQRPPNNGPAKSTNTRDIQ